MRINDRLQSEQSIPVLLLWRFFLAMLMYTLCRVFFLVYNADLLQLSGSEAVRSILLWGTRFDLSALLYVNALAIVLHLLPVPAKYSKPYQRSINITYWIFNIPAFVANLADVVYYRFSGKRTSLAAFTEFQNENPLNFLYFFVQYWGVTLFGLVLIALWIWLYYRLKAREKALLSSWRYYAFYTIALLVLTGLSVAGIRGGFTADIRPIGPNNASLYVEKPLQRAAVLNTPFVFIRLLGKQSLPEYRFMPESEAQAHFSALRTPSEDTEWTGKFAGRNVVLIIWESLSKEWVGSLNKNIKGYKGYTPFVDSLLTRSFYFERAYAGASKSIDAMPALLASIPKPIEPFISSAYSGNALYALPHILGQKGYDTRFYHNAPNGSMGFDAMARQVGFSSYRGMREFGNDDEFDGTWGIWDEPFLQYMAQDLSTLSQPFFATEFTTSSHSPFSIPKKYESRFPAGEHPQHRCMPYTDYALEQFFRTAQTKPWYNNTLFIITADHSIPGHLEEYKNANGLYSIPMIFFDPRGELKGVDCERVVQQADLLPTLLDLLGIKERHIAFGHNMFASGEEHFAVNNMVETFQLIRGDYALQFDGQRVVALYNVKQDPQMKHNLRDTSPEVLAELLPLFKAYLQEFSDRMRHDKLRP